MNGTELNVFKGQYTNSAGIPLSSKTTKDRLLLLGPPFGHPYSSHSFLESTGPGLGFYSVTECTGFTVADELETLAFVVSL